MNDLSAIKRELILAQYDSIPVVANFGEYNDAIERYKSGQTAPEIRLRSGRHLCGFSVLQVEPLFREPQTGPSLVYGVVTHGNILKSEDNVQEPNADKGKYLAVLFDEPSLIGSWIKKRKAGHEIKGSLYDPNAERVDS